MSMNRYELHCHTKEVSPCAKVPASEVIRFYASHGWAGVFITDHFICGRPLPEGVCWEEHIDAFCAGYEKAREEGEKLGLPVFFGFEYTCLPHSGTDFLVYGLDKDWLKNNSAIKDMRLGEGLDFMAGQGAFIAQAHPFRESSYIEMIRLLPRKAAAVEVINANRNDIENKAADNYARYYSLKRVAGTDNHKGGEQERFCGIDTEKTISRPGDLAEIVYSGMYSLFDITR